MRSARLFFVIFLLFELAFLKTDFFDSLVFLWDKQDFSLFLIFLIYVVASLFCFFYFLVLAFSSDWKYKIIYFLFFTTAVFFEYGYQKALGRFSVFSDIENIFSTNLGHKLSASFSYLNVTALLPCLVFLILLIKIKPSQKPQKLKAFAGIILISVFLYAQISYLNVYLLERRTPLFSLDSFCRATTDFVLWGSFSNGLIRERTILEKPRLAENFRPANNIVLIIDESMRGDHLSLNGYDRKTTPFLDELQSRGILHNWGIAAAATTGSHTTYDILITGLTPDDFPDNTNVKLFTSPTVFQYAKAMNYTTHYFDGQMTLPWGGASDDKKYIDNWTGVDLSKKENVWERDRRIAQSVQNIISTSSGNFILIFTHGNHIPYHENYPEEAAVWQPSYVSSYKFDIPPPEKYQEIVNSYDNAIKHNTDALFKNLIPDYSAIPNNTVIVYTGDHGQTFYADGKASHGGTTSAEANVPIFIIGDLGKTIDTNYKASHQNLLPTILDLMNYPEEKRHHKYALSLLQAVEKDSQPRYFNPLKMKKILFSP